MCHLFPEVSSASDGLHSSESFILSAIQYPLLLALCDTRCKTDTRFLKEFMVPLERNVRKTRKKNVPLKYNRLKINLFCNNID